MKLGLCCMLDTTKMKKGFVGINAFNKCSNPLPKLIEATLHNIKQSKQCLEWVVENKTGMYRFSSDIIPFAEFWDWENNLMVKHGLEQLKSIVVKNNIRTTIHPSQFCVINSDKPNVVENSIKILKHHYRLCQALSIDNIIIHTGSAKGNYKERFVDGFLKLCPQLQSLIRLENCHSVSILDVIEICDVCNIKPIFDIHHNRICGNVDINKNLISKIKTFWEEEIPIGHISSGKTLPTDKSHNDFITSDDINKFRDLFDVFDLEIEAKKKDLAILKIKKEV